MLKKIGRVILWILFWYFLLPYTLLKKYVFKNIKYKRLWSSLIAIFLILFLLVKIGNSDDTESEHTESPKIHYVTKKLGTKELEKQKNRAKTLAEKKKKKEKEYSELKSELNTQEKAKEKEAYSEKQSENKITSSSEEKKKSSSNTSKKSNSTRNTEDAKSSDDSNNDDINTSESGQIVGNSKSKIYHVPGQAGYRMNSANAVYFNSEQEAIAAGYRKALR